MTLESIIVFQHVSVEHPGIFRNFFDDDGIQLHTVELDKGEKIPELKEFDALWVMGGPMDVWEEDKAWRDEAFYQFECTPNFFQMADIESYTFS